MSEFAIQRYLSFGSLIGFASALVFPVAGLALGGALFASKFLRLVYNRDAREAYLTEKTVQRARTDGILNAERTRLYAEREAERAQDERIKLAQMRYDQDCRINDQEHRTHVYDTERNLISRLYTNAQNWFSTYINGLTQNERANVRGYTFQEPRKTFLGRMSPLEFRF